MRSPLWLEILRLDLRYALRRLAKNPAFTIVACLSLALGIGANTAAFGVLYAVLLRSLPVKDPAALVVVSTRNTGFQYSMSHPAYLYLRDHSSSFEGLIAFRAQTRERQRRAGDRSRDRHARLGQLLRRARRQHGARLADRRRR